MTNDIYSERKKKALDILLKAVGSKKVRLAEELDVSIQTVQMWFLRNQISKAGAEKVSQHKLLSQYITKEELRPDVSW